MSFVSSIEYLIFGGSSFVFGASAFSCVYAWLQKRKRTSTLRNITLLQAGVKESKAKDLQEFVIQAAIKQSKKTSFFAQSRTHINLLAERNEDSLFNKHLLYAGLFEEVNTQACLQCVFRFLLLGGITGFLFGYLASIELAILGGVAGALFGFLVLPASILSLEKKRHESILKDLPDMLDVLSMGLQSGLSIDRSIALYATHFSGLLASSCMKAYKTWSCGLLPRDEALRNMAKTFKGTEINRVVESIIRSLKFGTSLSDILLQYATELRNAYRTKRQENISKVSVKMMIPTGVLMLPALLIFILGPVLLQLLGGM